uniref:FAS1 domain-containing protein n=1 Tax=Nelumbo nucifera TaxID=4432 RepID=A0A822XY53_NELNU|nr:TPA_asm: hypothetical protein HUJ06_026406 [Nelumbo nucifera]
MAILLNQGPSLSFFKLSLTFPLFFLLLSLAVSTASSPAAAASSSAAETLRNRGYSFFANAIAAAIDLRGWNGTGTVFATPDSSFSYATAKFKNGRAPPPPATSLLLYHTLRETLLFEDLRTLPVGKAFPTFARRNCLYICKNPSGELGIAGRKKPKGYCVIIRQPNLYVQEDLIIHGVDAILDPSSGSKCRISPVDLLTGTASSPYSKVDRDSFLDDAVTVLRSRGYSVVATSMVVRHKDLTNLTGVTVFAPSDESLFTLTDGFRYDFRYHAVPQLLRLSDLKRLPNGSKIKTLVPGKEIVVRSVNGVILVNGIKVDSTEIYNNRSVVIIGISHPMPTRNGLFITAFPHMNQDSGQFVGGWSDFSISPMTADPPYFPEIGVPPTTVESPFYSDTEFQSSAIYGGEIALGPMTQERTAGDDGSPDPAKSVVPTTAPLSFTGYGDENLLKIKGNNSPSPSAYASVSSSSSNARCSPAVANVKIDGISSALLAELGEFFCPFNGRINAEEPDVAPVSSSIDSGQPGNDDIPPLFSFPTAYF